MSDLKSWRLVSVTCQIDVLLEVLSSSDEEAVKAAQNVVCEVDNSTQEDFEYASTGFEGHAVGVETSNLPDGIEFYKSKSHDSIGSVVCHMRRK